MKRRLLRFSAQCLSKLIILFLSILMLAGCWDYQGLGDQTVVVGVAVDLGEAGSGYRLTFEIVDLNEGEGGQFGSVLLTTRGETLAEAVYDAYARLHSHVYLGVVEVVLISQAVAEQRGIEPIVNYLIREKNARNSLRVVVAGSETAAALFAPAEGDTGAEEAEGPGQTEGQRQPLSRALGEALSPRRRGASSVTDARALYEVYQMLAKDTSDLALPIVGQSAVEDIPFQLDGIGRAHV